MSDRDAPVPSDAASRPGRPEGTLRVPSDADLRAATRTAAGVLGAEPGDEHGARGWLLRVAILLAAGLVLATLVGRTLLVGPVFDVIDTTLPPDVHTLVVGASHAACALDPAAFAALPHGDPTPGESSGRAVSVARHGELMVSTHAKLAALLRDNPGVRRVLLAFAPIHVAAWQDAHLLGGDAHSRTQLMEYYPLFDAVTRAELPAWQSDVLLARLKYDLGVPFDLTDDAALHVRHLTGRLEPWHRRLWGGYTPLSGTHLDGDLLRLVEQRYFREGDEAAGLSARAERSLRRIVDLTREVGVQLVLLDTPVHASFRAIVPERQRLAHERVLASLAEQAPHVVILRHADLPLPDEVFLDPDHLNADGAARYSALVADALAQLEGGGR